MRSQRDTASASNSDAGTTYDGRRWRRRQTLGAQVLERTPPRECRTVRRGVSGVLGFARRTCDIPTKDVFSPPNAPGSVLMSVGNAEDSVSILLIPQVKSV